MDKYYFSSEISKLLNPPPQSKFLVRQRDAIEELYPSRKKAPLGFTHAPNIPRESVEMIFGIRTPKDSSAGDLIYPSKIRINQSVYSEVYHFKKPIDSARSVKIQADHFNNAGDQMKELLNYDRNKYSTIIVPSYDKKVSANCFKMKPNGETFSCTFPEQTHEFNVPRDNTEGKIEKDKKAKVERNHVEVLWNLLKKKNHLNFLDLVSSFKAYQDGHDKITVSDLQKMCEKFGISAPVHIIEKLVEECDIIDKDGAISYEEFIHCLNWKNMLPENNNFKTSKYASDWRTSSSSPQDITDLYRTTSSFIGDHKYSVNPRNAGLPSRIDVDKSNLKGVSNVFNECGEASSMIQPNSFSKYGVFEEDLKALYSKEQIKQILGSRGIKVSNDAFEKVWCNVNWNGKASIGTVWSALKNACLSHCKHM